MSSRGRFQDQVAVVTGAGRGMGRAVALALGQEGASVVVAELDPVTAEESAAQIRSEGGEATAVSADISKVAEVQRLFEEIDRAYGAPNILVNNAGIGIAKPLVDYSEDEFERQMGVNLKGLLFCTQAAARRMIPNRRGKIVNFASTAAFVSSSTPEVAYDASKGAVRALTVSAAAELAGHGINVNAVAPGTILTDLTLHVLDTDEKMSRAAAKIPMNRLGEPGDMVGPVLFLCSEDAAYVTGHVIVVDGGWLLY